MKRQHFSHKHPLFLGEVNDDSEAIVCKGCWQTISGSAYSCQKCSFFLHKLCAELPTEIKHPFDEMHPLRLQQLRSSTVCDVCEESIHGFTYRCFRCNVNVDIVCYFRAQHFSHKHKLILLHQNEEKKNDDGERVSCYGCLQPITGSAAAYRCTICSIHLHKLCGELPTEIKHPFHEMHPLRLQQPESSTVCDVCEESIHGFTYGCSPCDFYVDIICYFRAQHFSDKHHQLILHQNEEKKNEDGDRVSCDGCLQPITGSAVYRCTICSISLHKFCGELPAEVQHQMHPQHPLTLLPVLLLPNELICHSCDAYLKSLFAYRCTLCKFNLDISCALREETVKHESHIHPLSPVLSPASFECHACLTKREDISYMCRTCTFWIHESCASLPTTFKHRNHGHLLTLIYSIRECSNFSWPECSVCDEDLLRESFGWFYACHGCKYFIHVNCSSKTKEGKIAIKIEDLDEANFIHLPMSDDQSVNLIDQFVKQISLKDIKSEVKDNCFSHEHPLILFDAQGDNDLYSRNELLILKEQKNKKVCNACVRQISVPFYSCSLCDFFLHKWCAELPNELKHPCHQHQLILLKNCPENRGLFWSKCCGNACNGFAFKCVECVDYHLDVKCACLPSSIIHKAHECSCPLFLRTDCIKEGCVACPRCIKMFSFGCDNCNFNLHYTCALLPHTINHRYDKHPFTLIYAPIEDGSEEYICEFCEKEIDPKYWFYHCIHCDQSACATCIYKQENETIKWGITYDSQPHPLVLVEATDKTPRCDYCDEMFNLNDSFERATFKCEQCDIILHSDCRHPNINSSLE